MKDWAAVEAFALSLPDAATGTSWRQPAVTVGGKAFVSTGREVGSFHVRSTHEEKALLIETDPATFWQTAHYANWPGLLVRYGSADPDRVKAVIARAWWDAARRAQRERFGARP
ncbi:hypothetical protein SAMN06297144_1901 [Sphingomonas guangdongensis]|uniref:YjbR protein n=1 Tax=Sphingomonas guangdongensis TaxID=1141890 RepID=A0A285QY87_9SPHN|nr:MmcQ/YjbR family DNA-binding protein [Sphingomonas guangdongensis]SOB86791.1 hypothetical protein SAMN06297144_1901 [Sphingomonas guangdongensis]